MVGVKRSQGSLREKVFSREWTGISIVHKALRRKGIYFRNFQKFIEKHEYKSNLPSIVRLNAFAYDN